MNRVAQLGVGVRRAFTLIEVLIGILILAIGLLGIGAVIPVVVREQRAASDATLGTVAALQAEQVLRSRGGFAPETPGPRLTPWDVLLFNRSWSPGPTPTSTPPAPYYLWDVRTSITDPTGVRDLDANNRILTTGSVFTLYDTNAGLPSDTVVGDMDWFVENATRETRLGATSPWTTVASYSRSSQRLRLADRLWPSRDVQPMSSDQLPPGRDPFRPQFVWDFVTRRVPVRSSALVSAPESVQVAVFVRRIDLNIAVPRGTVPGSNPARDYTLLDVIADPNLAPAGARRAAVAADEAGLPTNSGFDQRTPGVLRYSTIQVLNAGLAPWYADRDIRNVIRLRAATGQNAAMLRVVSAPGQKLVDNFGTVYTVRGVPDNAEAPSPGTGEIDLVVEPAVPIDVNNSLASTPPLDTDNSTLRQVIFTPQVPAAVRVFTVTRPPQAPVNF